MSLNSQGFLVEGRACGKDPDSSPGVERGRSWQKSSDPLLNKNSIDERLLLGVEKDRRLLLGVEREQRSRAKTKGGTQLASKINGNLIRGVGKDRRSLRGVGKGG